VEEKKNITFYFVVIFWITNESKVRRVLLFRDLGNVVFVALYFVTYCGYIRTGTRVID